MTTTLTVRTVAAAIAWAVVVCVASGSLHAAKSNPSRRPNVLLIVTDDQRPDTIHALGNDIIQTPRLDELVRQGVTFTRAIAPDPLCVPSRAEIMTGCREFSNGVSSLTGGRMDPERKLWAQTMRDAGYMSWYVGKWMNDGKPITRGYHETDGLFAGGGMAYWRDMVDHHGQPVTGYRGWIFQKDDGTRLPELGVGLTADISRHFADAAIRFLRRESDRPFFLHVNFTAPHDPLLVPPGYEQMYDPAEMPLPPNFKPQHPFDHGNLHGRDEMLLPFPRTENDVRNDLAVYYAVISHMDHHIGRILDALRDTPQADNTIVLFTSDHGLAVGSHGLRGKQNMYEHTVGVPLVIAGPGIPAGVRRDAQCYLRDLYPTACELADVEIPDTVQGRSLAPVIDGRVETVYPHVVGHFRDVQRMIRTDRWKLIYYPKIDKVQLFDLRNDPHELTNLADHPRHATVQADLRTQLNEWLREAGDPQYR